MLKRSTVGSGFISFPAGAVLAALLARDAKSLLIGEHRQITAVNHVRTIHTAPDEVFVAASVDFEDRMSMGEGETLIEALETRLRAEMPELTTIYIRPEKRENDDVVLRDPA